MNDRIPVNPRPVGNADQINADRISRELLKQMYAIESISSTNDSSSFLYLKRIDSSFQ
jgi:hypothetical protein